MKATGIVRKVDNLGRIVIPKETRRILQVDSGDALEIFVEEDAIILQKNIY
ncbi:AbrB family transcriptional regulator, partial [Bacillus thuringiensis]|nr:AbrB family transcriptional regulator [Bacillus thuringiensis]